MTSALIPLREFYGVVSCENTFDRPAMAMIWVTHSGASLERLAEKNFGGIGVAAGDRSEGARIALGKLKVTE